MELFLFITGLSLAVCTDGGPHWVRRLALHGWVVVWLLHIYCCA